MPSEADEFNRLMSKSRSVLLVFLHANIYKFSLSIHTVQVAIRPPNSFSTKVSYFCSNKRDTLLSRFIVSSNSFKRLCYGNWSSSCRANNFLIFLNVKGWDRVFQTWKNKVLGSGSGLFSSFSFFWRVLNHIFLSFDPYVTLIWFFLFSENILQ